MKTPLDWQRLMHEPPYKDMSFGEVVEAIQRDALEAAVTPIIAISKRCKQYSLFSSDKDDLERLANSQAFADGIAKLIIKLIPPKKGE